MVAFSGWQPFKEMIVRRRTFFGGLVASIAAAFGAAQRSKAEAFYPRKPERDGNGNCVCRVYRENDEGVWWEISISDVKPGDRIICIGQDGKRLWRTDSMRVDEIVPARPGSTEGVISSNHTSLMSSPDGWLQPVGLDFDGVFKPVNELANKRLTLSVG